MQIIYKILKRQLHNLSYCPERIVQGYAVKELKNLPQIVSAFNKYSEKKQLIFFQNNKSYY